MSKHKRSIQPLGELESDIMSVMWKLRQASVRQVLDKLTKGKRIIAYTTIMTVMARLCKKKILKRQLDKSGTYLYVPSQNKECFLKEASRKIVKNFVKEFGELGVAQFIDVIENSDQKQISEWKKKLGNIN